MLQRIMTIACLLLCACAHRFPALDASIDKELAAGIPSIAVAVAKDGRIVHEAAFGFADAGRRATTDTPYPLASVTKPFIATAFLRLSARGVIDLDQPASRYAGGWVRESERYTLRQLLNHTSGLPTYARIYWNDETPRPLETMFRRYGFTAHAPGIVSEYSNLGYGLLGHILEVRTGENLSTLLQRELFRPLGLRHTMLVDSAASPRGAARKYDAAGKPLPATYNDTPGAGNLYASVHDLVRFGMHHLATPSLRVMQTYVEPGALYPYYNSSHYGLGWYFRTTPGGTRVVWHEGGMPGASSILVLLPDYDVAAAVLINANDRNDVAQSIINRLIAAVEPSIGKLTFDAVEGFTPAQWTGHWEGTISIDGRPLPCTMAFARDGKVGVTVAGQTATFPALANGDLLLGTFSATLPADGVEQKSGYVLVRLVRRGDALNGTMIAYAAPDGLRYLYPFAVRMQKK